MRALFISIVCIALSGCASIWEREGKFMSSSPSPRRSEMTTPVFAGTVVDAGGIVGGLSAPVVCWFSDDVYVSDVLLLPFGLIDLIPSLFADLIYLPGDIKYWRHGGGQESGESDQSGAPASPTQ